MEFDELAFKIEPLMYNTDKGGGNVKREYPDGNRNANISSTHTKQNGVNRCFTQRGMECFFSLQT